MSPCDLEVLIHCYALPGPHPRIEAPAVQSAIQGFISDGIIRPDGEKDSYTTTERGSAWMKLILDTPMPVQVWTDPRQGKKV